MLQSMTGYGDACIEKNGVSVSIEIRSINNRYLKISPRFSEPMGALELQIEEELRKSISRGSVNLNVKITRTRKTDSYQLNVDLLNSYRDQLCCWLSDSGIDTDKWTKFPSLLNLPGIVDNSTEDDSAVLAPIVLETLNLAVEKLVAMRVREGKAMAEDLLVNLCDIEKHLAFVIERAPQIAVIFGERLVERLNKLFEQQGVQIEQADVIREIGIFADKCDISEEIARLKSHISQFRSILANEPSPGKKLDFLTQELFREVNTIGSKANDFAISQEVIHMKASIERIREQVQNIE
ncbi:MAG: YicC/YloC family endoribonuclease [Planctomycetia bacterium]|nr:YicC/YloC family endoribonuclease [Planctomycetia bacterium]